MPNKSDITTEHEAYFEIGEFLERLLSEEIKRIKPGDKLIEICERIEERIRDEGFLPAFPVNISVNEVAAHYTSPPMDRTRVPEGSLVKLDVGIRKEGYIVDAARTLVFNDKLKDLAEAAKACLEAAKKIMRPKTSLRQVGYVIYEEAKKHGFKTISNLSGHKIGMYKLHAGVGVPNIPIRVGYKLRVGDVFAVEPFLTYKEVPGIAKPLKEVYIFSFKKEIRSTNEIQERIIFLAKKKFKKLPFAERWLMREFSCDIEKDLFFLIKKGAFNLYPVLVEAGGGIVSQEEDTFLITEEGAISLTRR